MPIGSQEKQVGLAGDIASFGTAATGCFFNPTPIGGGLYRFEFTLQNWSTLITDNGTTGSTTGSSAFFTLSSTNGLLVLAGRAKLTTTTTVAAYASSSNIYVGVGTAAASADGTLSSAGGNLAIRASQTMVASAATVYARPVATPVLVAASGGFYLNFASATDPTTSSNGFVSSGSVELLVFHGND